MNVPLNVDVHCTDGRCGRSTHIILNPVTEKVMHIVVKEQEAPYTERIVPIKWVKETTPELILLNHTKDEVTALDVFNQTNFVQRDVPHYAADPKITELWPYVVPAKRIISEKHLQVPSGGRAVRRWARVKATNGDIGQVDEFIVDPESKYVTHLVLKEGLPWKKKQITIPVSEIERIENYTVYLKLNKQAVKALPTVRRRRK
jgi:sporulation protein YlmC with PRC-barrel domain